eukprot:6112568-Prymnesium_polylepis.1
MPGCAQMLLVASAISNGGDVVVLFLLFGVAEGIFLAPERWIHSFLTFLFQSHVKHGISEAEVKDAVQEAAGGTGYFVELAPTRAERDDAARVIARTAAWRR